MRRMKEGSAVTKARLSEAEDSGSARSDLGSETHGSGVGIIGNERIVVWMEAKRLS